MDTSVVVSALRSRLGASNAVLGMVAMGQITALATPPLFLEYEDVLKRPEQRLVHGLAITEIDEFLAEFAALIEPTETHFQWRPQVRDPADEMVLEAALNGHADALVTFNIADFEDAGRRFRMPILTPAEVLRRVRL
ncbi:MAG TPA: putative toxin-antitoxin system toxin component, PIN family [Candidatus Angelobacter sp.]